jgi:hypothetical protein
LFIPTFICILLTLVFRHVCMYTYMYMRVYKIQPSIAYHAPNVIIQTNN